MAHSYSHLYRLSVTGLRFFTIYGPWGRPDMAIAFTTASSKASRLDFSTMAGCAATSPISTSRPCSIEPSSIVFPSNSRWNAPARIYNVVNHHPEELLHVVALLEKELGRPAQKDMLPMQPERCAGTFADIGDLNARHRLQARDDHTRMESGISSRGIATTTRFKALMTRRIIH